MAPKQFCIQNIILYIRTNMNIHVKKKRMEKLCKGEFFMVLIKGAYSG